MNRSCSTPIPAVSVPYDALKLQFPIDGIRIRAVPHIKNPFVSDPDFTFDQFFVLHRQYPCIIKFRSYADDMPLQAWLNERIFPVEAKLDGETIFHLTKLAVLEYLTSGITAIFDMYRFGKMRINRCLILVRQSGNPFQKLL